MTPDRTEDVAFIKALATACREVGVRECEVMGVRLVLGPLETPSKGDELKPDDDMCKCGHPLHDHGPLCLHGCDVDRCGKVTT